MDAAEPVSGDGATEFVSGVPSSVDLLEPGSRFEQQDDDPLSPGVFDGGRIYGLSAYAGLVITDASAAGPSRVEGRYPLSAVPFDLSVRDGIALVLVNDATVFPCFDNPLCQLGEGSRVLLIDARDPSSPQLLAERTFAGALTHSHELGNVLYLVTRELVPCGLGPDCQGLYERHARVTAIGLDDPLSLVDLGQLELPTAEPVARSYHFAGERLYVGTDQINLSVIELDRGMRLGPTAPLPGVVANESQFTEQAGVFVASVLATEGSERTELHYRVGPGELEPIEPVVFSAPGGERVEPVFHGAGAYALSEDGATLLGYDVTERRAPRLAATLTLPFAASALLPTLEGELIALGSGETRDAAGALHVARIDIRDPAAPLLVAQLSTGSARTLRLGHRYDAASERLLLNYTQGELSGGIQVIDTRAGELTLGASVRGGGQLAQYVVARERLVRVHASVIRASSTGIEQGTVNIPLARPADTVRVVGEHLVRFARDSVEAHLVPLSTDDPVISDGTALSASLEPRGAWLPQAFQRDEQLYLVKGVVIGRQRRFDVSGFDLSDPNAVVPTTSLSLPPPSEDEQYLGVIQTKNRLLVTRGPVVTSPSADSRYRGTGLSHDVIDLSEPGAPRLAARVDLPEAVVAAGFQRFPSGTTLDTRWGWQTAGAPLVVDADIVVSQHSEPLDQSQLRFFLDRVDLSQADAPVLQPPVNIPGIPLSFDAESGSLVSIETLRFEERTRSAEDCKRQGYLSSYSLQRTCQVTRRALSGLFVEDDIATRRSQLLLDTSRRALSFAVSGEHIYYVTEPLLTAAEAQSATPGEGTPITLERVRVQGGELERLPSVDISALHPELPRHWQALLARDNRVFSVSGEQLGVIDFSVNPPSVRTLALPPWGCSSFDVAGSKAYCARGQAGLAIIDLD